MTSDEQGGALPSGRATAVEPVPVSPLRDGIPSVLRDIVGEGVFEIVPKADIRHPLDADAAGVIFTISNRTFLVFEDPDDGYRSNAGPLLSFPGSAYEIGGGGFPFPTYIHEPVVCSHRASGAYGGEDDVLEVRSKETGELIFEVGTENVDDYYPSYVCRWHPQGLSANAKARACD